MEPKVWCSQPAQKPSENIFNSLIAGTSLVVQWLRLRASTAGGEGSIPGPGTKIPHAA